MSNKENLSPQAEIGRHLRGIPHNSPPLTLLSPNSKPSLARQRDHSGCRRAAADSPLKVRKTRENLKNCAIYTDIPPPCLHPPDEPCDISGTTFGQDELNDAGATSSPPATGRLTRTKSASKRMLSKVKDGIVQRSRSTHAVRATESDNSLTRRLSGKKRHSREEHSRLRSFEMNRENTESPDPTASQRSFTASSITVGELTGSTTLVSDRSVTPEKQTTPGRRSPGRLLCPSPVQRSPTPEATPRASRPQPLITAIGEPRRAHITVPYVDLQVSLDRDSVDVGLARDLWVAIEATVRQRTVEDTSPPAGGVHGAALAAPSVGRISSVRLCYKAMNDCRVAEVVGQKAAKDLDIGDHCSLFLKLHVPRMDIRPRDDAADDGRGPDALFRELESILGVLETQILHVEARYRHAALPSTHVVTIRQLLSINRPQTDSRWSMVGTSSPSSPPQFPTTTTTARGPPGPTSAKPAVIITPAASNPPTTVPSTKAMTISAPKVTTAISVVSPETETDAHDSARQLWRHIRRTSLSAQQLVDMSPATLAATDDALRELRDRALANKRSVGAETLRAWRWDGKVGAETPWL